MNIYKILNTATAIIFLLAFGSCNKTADISKSADASATTTVLQELVSENGTNPDDAIFLNPVSYKKHGHLYLESNRHGKNTIFVFGLREDGSLVLSDEVTSGGSGTGEALGSQGALAISESNNLLFAVNAGSNSISSFRLKDNGGLDLLFTATTNGQLPNSITVHENLVYVLNTLSSTICGFTFTSNGFLSFIDGSKHELSGMNADAPQIKFQPDGKALYVTEKATNTIDKFELDHNGAVASVIHIPSHGVTPFGFDFARNKQYLIVTNAAMDFSGAGSCTSYQPTNSGLEVMSGPVSNFQTSPCWVTTTQYGSYAFVSNTGSNCISSYYIDKNGAITLLKSVAAQNGKAPIDIVVSADNRYVYNINSGSHTLSGYQRMSAGEIKFIDKVTVLPDYAAGLIAH